MTFNSITPVFRNNTSVQANKGLTPNFGCQPIKPETEPVKDAPKLQEPKEDTFVKTTEQKPENNKNKKDVSFKSNKAENKFTEFVKNLFIKSASKK